MTTNKENESLSLARADAHGCSAASSADNICNISVWRHCSLTVRWRTIAEDNDCACAKISFHVTNLGFISLNRNGNRLFHSAMTCDEMRLRNEMNIKASVDMNPASNKTGGRGADENDAQ